MTAQLILLCCGATATARAGGFAAPDERLDAAGLAAATRIRPKGMRSAVVGVSPAVAARQTAEAIGMDATVAGEIADMDWGDWSGRALAAVHADAPDALAAWLADPAAGTPGGESFAAVRSRLQPWLGGIVTRGGRTIAITHPMIVRAALTLAIGVAIEVAMRIDIAPVSVTELSFNRGWRLRELRRA